MNKQKGSIDMGYIIIAVILILALWIGIYVPIAGLHKVISNGTHVGYVTATEESGLVFKTGTAYIKTDVSSSQEDSYCVIDKEVLAQLKEMSILKEKVELTYISYFSAGITNCAGEGVIITGVNNLK